MRKKSRQILVVDGARQVGKSFIIRHVGKKLFQNYIEVNLLEDSLSERRFERVGSVNDFYFQLSMVYGDLMDSRENTLIFLDEIQAYPHLLTLLKFLREDNKFTYIASGSLLGVTLARTSSIPMGGIEILPMYPLDFEEFLLANGFNRAAIQRLKADFANRKQQDETTHRNLMDLFKRYLIVGGMPDAVNSFVETRNVAKIRKVQSEIHEFYATDASKYDQENRLKIRRIYDMVPSNLGNKKKRVVASKIDNKKGAVMSKYSDEFDYLTNSGIALEVDAVSAPKFPLLESGTKNLLKLYMNDVGILSNILYGMNPKAILDDERSINLGTLYENMVACELKAHGFRLFYYDNRDRGEVDFLVDDYADLSCLPIEVKSGKDYYIHRALNNFLETKDYNVRKGIVFSNERKVFTDEKNITYMPIYYVMFVEPYAGIFQVLL